MHCDDGFPKQATQPRVCPTLQHAVAREVFGGDKVQDRRVEAEHGGLASVVKTGDAAVLDVYVDVKAAARRRAPGGINPPA